MSRVAGGPKHLHDIIREQLSYLRSYGPPRYKFIVLEMINPLTRKYVIAYISRTGPSEYNIQIKGIANMNCTDIECVMDLLKPYYIDSVLAPFGPDTIEQYDAEYYS